MSDSSKNIHNKVLGRQGEQLTCKYLRKNGYKIVQQNYVTPFGEADIIAYKKGVYCFVEVKTRNSSEDCHALRGGQRTPNGNVTVKWRGISAICSVKKSAADSTSHRSATGCWNISRTHTVKSCTTGCYEIGRCGLCKNNRVGKRTADYGKCFGKFERRSPSDDRHHDEKHYRKTFNDLRYLRRVAYHVAGVFSRLCLLPKILPIRTKCLK